MKSSKSSESKYPQPSISLSKGAVPAAGGAFAPRAVSGAIISSVKRNIQRVALADIALGSGHRALNDDHVEELRKSIERIDLTTPIFVVVGPLGVVTLIAGQHRLEAMRRLGRTHIDAFVLDADVTNNRLLTLSENLHRLGYCALERAEAENEWLQASQNDPGQLAQSSRHQPNDRGISRTSRTLDVSRRELKRAQQIAGISPEAKLKARELKLHDNQSALLKIAKGLTAEDQVKIATDIIERKNQRSRLCSIEAASAPAMVSQPQLPPVNYVASCGGPASSDLPIPDFFKRGDPEEHFNKLLAAWNVASLLRVAWADALPVARSRFVFEVLHVEPCVAPSMQSEADHG
ncbi:MULTISPECIES: ParB/RepB/Spo0J family partition protein [unclassified Bradyrhizobium]|uniref:ParB/RepB/Spo0J family partition protein n=1 Tax=Bradyrhizobium sp. USDA 4541 TaxID=2817704 RepID=UPI0020A3434A|nr:ParB/RepB/Spo0J family partition protein [Bradyrhizobium sp. USDA 4541]MCP1848369.1 ParB-like chromosome segregation protein Spo0J [Bradyrhizobium sp. USDA 4541]